MVKLKFGPTTSAKGFTSLETSSFNDLPPAKIVREIIQNSLDAAVEVGEATAIVRFREDSVLPKDIPDVKGYQEAFDKAAKYWKKRGDGKLADPAQQVVNHISSALQSLEKGKATLLSVLDNGIGLDVRRMNSLLSDGASDKQYELSGSYGVGHLAPMALSDIRYMLYGGLAGGGARIACGRAILASHPGNAKLMSADGYLVKDFRGGLDGNLYEFLPKGSQPRIVADRLDEIESEWGHGCAIIIPAFNNFRSGGMKLWDIVSKVAAYNFCAAIHRDKLMVEVRQGSDEKRLDKNSILSILEVDRERTRAARSGSFFEGLRPSGQNAYSTLKALTEDGGQSVDTDIGRARISLMLPSVTGRPRIDLFRNGMWITDEIPGLNRADFADRQPFHAVIEIEGKDDSQLHRLIRKAEGPMHDKLSLSLLSYQERRDLEAALASIAGWLKDKVPTIGLDEYTVDDFLLVRTDPNGNTGRESFSFWGVPTPVLRRRSNQLALGLERTEVDPPDPEPGPTPPKPPGPPNPPKPRQQKRANPLPFRSVVVPDGKGRLTASIATERDFPDVWMTIRVDENADFTCDRVWQDEDVSITSLTIRPVNGAKETPTSEVMADGRTVRVKGISAMTDYDVQLDYSAPQELTSTVGTPVFRLELYRPRNPQGPGKSRGEEAAQNADGN